MQLSIEGWKNMGYRKFSLLLAIRFSLLLATLVVLAYVFDYAGYAATTFLVLLVFLAQINETLRFISKTNTELVRFFEAARYADFSQHFDLKSMGSGFGELSSTFNDILKRFEVVRAAQEAELHHLKAVVEHIPVPLISIHTGGKLSLRNNSARRLFGSHSVSNIMDLKKFGDAFANEVTSIKPGQQRLVIFTIDGMEQQLAITATQIVIEGKQDMLVGLQNIQSELDRVQLNAWQELVRVLTHEIMNSITPVASLAKTSVDLVDDVRQKVESNDELLMALDDVADAVKTVSRRSEGLTNFVSSYRRLTHLPQPNKKFIKISQLFQQVLPLATLGWKEKNITLNTHIKPHELDINVDVNMIEQLLINLLKNSEQALENINDAKVSVNAYLNPRGHTVISVDDSGKGIDSDIAKKIFVPFFTTKKDGSGVGLALTRQVMAMHGGSVKLTQSKLGGAQFNLIF